MPALVADIAAITRPAQIEKVSNSAIKVRYANARDGSKEPAEGLFDLTADAVTALSARNGLLGTERRRFGVDVQDLVWPNPLEGMLTVSLVDPDQQADGAFLAARIELSLEDEATSYEIFG